MRRNVVLRRCVALLVAIEPALVASYAAADLPLPVPVDGMSRVSVPRDFHAPRPRFHSAHQGTGLLARRGTAVRSVGWGVVARIEEQPRGPAATGFAPIDPQLVIGAKPAPVAKRLEALVTSLPEHR